MLRAERARSEVAGVMRPGVVVALAAAMSLAAMSSCAPPASTVPLGSGPLALAERDAEARAEAKHAHPPARTRPEPAAPEPMAKADASKAALGGADDADDADDDDGAKPGAREQTARQPAFEGLYAGDDIAVFRITGLPEREQRDDKAKIRIEPGSADNINITLINSEDGSDLCQLVARIDGHAALIETAQPCFSDGGEGSLEAELTSGRVVLEGDRLRMDAQGTLSVALPDQELDGELSYTFKGERQ
jgi:hypothetical protein